MRNKFSWLLATALWPLPVAAQLRITVDLLDRAGLQQGVRERMKQEVSLIFRQAGLDLEWVDCAIVGQPSPECLAPLGPSRLRLEILTGKDRRGASITGVAIVQRAASVLAFVYAERVREITQKTGWDYADLLGHAAAHELGHLLLGSAGHSPAGIMRASWEIKDLWRLPHSGLVFLPGQLKKVQRHWHRSAAAARSLTLSCRNIPIRPEPVARWVFPIASACCLRAPRTGRHTAAGLGLGSALPCWARSESAATQNPETP